jgi:hypothetical protein
VLTGLLKDIVKPRLSAYKHAQLTDQGTQRLRPRLQNDVAMEDIDPPTDAMGVLNWVSQRIEVSLVLPQSNDYRNQQSNPICI